MLSVANVVSANVPALGWKALVLEKQAGSCGTVVECLRQMGWEVRICTDPDDVGALWADDDLFVVEAKSVDDSLRQLVKWVRNAGGDPYVLAVGDGYHDPSWMAAGRRGAHSVVQDGMAAGETQHEIEAACRWLAARRDFQPFGALAAPARGGLLSEAPVSATPDWLPLLLDKVDSGLSVLDSAFRYRMANRRWRELFGLQDQDIIGRSHFDIFPSLGQEWLETYRRALAGEAIRCEEDVVVGESGSLVPVRWEISPWRDRDGQAGGLLLLCEPLRHRAGAAPGPGDFEAGVAKSILASSQGWLVVQDPSGIVLGASRGLSESAGRRGRMFGRSYWEALAIESTDLPQEKFLEAMARWRDTQTFDFPARVQEKLKGPGGSIEVIWHLMPYQPEPNAPHGIVRVGVIKPAEAAPRPAVAATHWNHLWEDDFPVLMWEANCAGDFVRVGEGLRRLAGIKGQDAEFAAQFRSKVSSTDAWKQKVRACLTGGLPVDETMVVAADEGPSLLRFIGVRCGNDSVRGWAVTVPSENPPPATPPAAPAREATASLALPAGPEAIIERDQLRARLDRLMAALSEARRLAPESSGGVPDLADLFPAAVFLLDAEGMVVQANRQHSSLAGLEVKTGMDFAAWLHQAAGSGPEAEAVVERWRARVWRKQVPCILPLRTSGGVIKEVEFLGRLAGGGRLVVFARDVTDERRVLESLRASEARLRSFFDEASVGMVAVDESGHVIDANPALEAILGSSRRDLVGRSLGGVLAGWDERYKESAHHSERFSSTLPDGRIVGVSRLHGPGNATGAASLWQIDPSPVTAPPPAADKSTTTAQATRALRHRVNNDLQVLASLVSLENDGALPENQAGSARVAQRGLQVAALAYASTVHASSVEEPVDAAPFLTKVARLAMPAGCGDPDLDLKIDPLPVPASSFFLLGLALWELVDNAWRHGSVPVVALTHTGADGTWIEVADHGPGLPGLFDPRADARFGLLLVDLACRQFEGRMEWGSNQGAWFRVRIRPAVPPSEEPNVRPFQG